MATIFSKRLEEKYGKTNIRNGKYRDVIRDILARNNQKISNAIGRLTNSSYRQDLKKFSTEKAKAVKLPEMSEVLPKRSVHLIKGADSGNMISDTLRSDLERKLRNTLKGFDGTGQNRMEIQRGVTTGKINPKLIEEFREGVQKTFDGRTKPDPRTGTPGHVKNIAVTEIRSTVDMIKEKYADEVERTNPQLEMIKTWLHNKRLSKKPRETHITMNRVTIPKNLKFTVGREDGSGFDYMDRPHDPTAPGGQVIGCNCDIVYKARLKE